jgi:hypothetical protein
MMINIDLSSSSSLHKFSPDLSHLFDIDSAINTTLVTFPQVDLRISLRGNEEISFHHRSERRDAPRRKDFILRHVTGRESDPLRFVVGREGHVLLKPNIFSEMQISTTEHEGEKVPSQEVDWSLNMLDGATCTRGHIHSFPVRPTLSI